MVITKLGGIGRFVVVILFRLAFLLFVMLVLLMLMFWNYVIVCMIDFWFIGDILIVECQTVFWLGSNVTVRFLCFGLKVTFCFVCGDFW